MRRTTFWSALTPGQRELIDRFAKVRPYEAGTPLMRAGEAGTWLGVLRRGRVRVSAPGADREQVIAHRGPGDLIGELAVTGLPNRIATVTAITRVDVSVLTRAKVDSLISRDPQFLRVILAVVARRHAESDRYRAETETEPCVRVARALVDTAGRSGRELTRGLVINIESQGDFASIVGMSRNTVGRVFRTLRTAGVLSTDRGVVIVHDLARLRAAARLS